MRTFWAAISLCSMCPTLRFGTSIRSGQRPVEPKPPTPQKRGADMNARTALQTQWYGGPQQPRPPREGMTHG